MWSVFISHKSDDFVHAKVIYDALTAHGVKAFLSELSIAQAGRADYQDTIEDALDACDHMVLVGSKREFVESTWVKSEWRVFLHELRSGTKRGNLITVLADGMQPSELPIGLRSFQSLPLTEEGLQDLLAFIGEKVSHDPATGSSPEEQPPLMDRKRAADSVVGPAHMGGAIPDEEAEVKGKVEGFLLRLKSSPLFKGENMWLIGMLTLGFNHVLAGRHVVTATHGLLADLVKRDAPPGFGVKSRLVYAAAVLSYACGLGLLGEYVLSRLTDASLESFALDKVQALAGGGLLCMGAVVFLLWLWHALRRLDSWKAKNSVASQLPSVWRPGPDKMLFYSSSFSKIVLYSVLYVSNIYFMSILYDQFTVEFAAISFMPIFLLFLLFAGYIYVVFACGHFIMYELLWCFLDESYADSKKGVRNSSLIWIHLLLNLILNGLSLAIVMGIMAYL